MKIFLSSFLIFQSILTGQYGDKRKIEGGSDEEDLLQLQEKQLCKRELLISYGMTGYEESKSISFPECPAINQNCCSRTDQQNAKNLWNNQYKYYVERYYETYLITLKYLLGFSSETYLLATEFEMSPDLECKVAAVDYMSINMNPRMTVRIYEVMKKAILQLLNIRSGFYCIICDANNQNQIFEYWENTNTLNFDRVYFSQDFCLSLVNKNITFSHYLFFYVKRYLENLNTLYGCKAKQKFNATYEVSIEKTQEVKNCYYFRDKYFFYFCEKYCENFQLTKPDEIFDGDLYQLKSFVELIMEYRHQVFRYPNNNILTDGVGYEENLLRFNYGEIFRDVVLFRPVTQQVLLDKYRSDFLYYGGVNPEISVLDHKFTAVVDHIYLMSVSLIMMLI